MTVTSTYLTALQEEPTHLPASRSQGQLNSETKIRHIHKPPNVWLLVIPMLMALLLWLGSAIQSALLPTASSGPIYSMTTLWLQLARNPDSVLHHPVQVQATARFCALWISGSGSTCLSQQSQLVENQSPSASAAMPMIIADAAMPLIIEDAPRLRTLVRGLPVLGALLPAPQVIQWEAPAVYTITIEPQPCADRSTGGCYQAVAVDAVVSHPLTR